MRPTTMVKTTWSVIQKPKFPKFKEDLKTDVLIVGGGLAGVVTAYMLALSGKKVVLCEANEIGSGATHMTTAFLTHILDTGLSDLIKLFGKKNARFAWESHAKAIDLIEEISRQEKIDCEFKRVSGYVFAGAEDQDKDIKDEVEHSKKIGFTNLSYKKSGLPFKNFGYFEAKRQGQYHPLKFLYGLALKSKERGVLIFEKTSILKISGKFIARTQSGFRIVADKIVVCTYQPFNSPKNVFAKKGMYKSYVMEIEIPRDALREGIYEDSYSPYNYFRVDYIDSRRARMILGGADHRIELPMSPAKNFGALENFLETIFEGKLKYKIVRKWTGPILEPSDGLALIGEYKPDEYIATAFSGTGMTYSLISGALIKDLILGKKNPWAELYDPKRPRNIKRYSKKALDYAEELWGGAVKNSLKHRKAKNS